MNLQIQTKLNMIINMKVEIEKTLTMKQEEEIQKQSECHLIDVIKLYKYLMSN